MRRGKVYLAGAGPGDPELLTGKALQILEKADVFIYDRLVSAEVLACANPAATLICAGKQQGHREATQSEIFGWLLHYDERADIIVRRKSGTGAALASVATANIERTSAPQSVVPHPLKSGDPTGFGRCGEQLECLAAHGIEAEVVPGISSALGGPAHAGIPLTYRGVSGSFAVIAGHRKGLTTLDWSVYRGVDTLVVLMGVEHRDIIAAALIAEGRPATLPVAFIERATTDRDRVIETTLGDVARRRTEVHAPAVFVIGEVVRLRSKVLALTAEAAATA